MKHINLSYIKKQAEDYADNLNSAWTNDYWAFIKGMKQAFTIMDVMIIDDTVKYEYISDKFTGHGLKKGELYHVIDEDGGIVHVVGEDNVLIPFSLLAFEINFKKVDDNLQNLR